MDTVGASLLATQQAAWAAQSAAEAAWWGVLLSGLGAVAALGALFWTIRITQADRRRAAREDAMFLHSAAALLRDVYNQIEDFHEETEDRQEEIGACCDRLRVLEDDQVFEQLIGINLRDFPSIGSFSAFSRGRANAQLAKVLLIGGLDRAVDRGHLYGVSGSLLFDIGRLEGEAFDPDYARVPWALWFRVRIRRWLEALLKTLGISESPPAAESKP